MRTKHTIRDSWDALTVKQLKVVANGCTIKVPSRFKKDQIIDMLMADKKCNFVKKTMDGKLDSEEKKTLDRLFSKRTLVGVAQGFDIKIDEKASKQDIIEEFSSTRKGAIIGSAFGVVFSLFTIIPRLAVNTEMSHFERALAMIVGTSGISAVFGGQMALISAITGIPWNKKHKLAIKK
jgi:hypothetical protein